MRCALRNNKIMNDAHFIEPASRVAGSTAVASGWQILQVKARIDAFSQEELIKDLAAAKEQGHKQIALDLKNNRFLSFNAIRFCAEVAAELYNNGGSLALIGCAEKTKRHFEIYGSLKHIRIVRTVLEL